MQLILQQIQQFYDQNSQFQHNSIHTNYAKPLIVQLRRTQWHDLNPQQKTIE